MFYFQFFAPGDEVFDCIVDNAMNSYKGTCTAFALEADFDWRGIVYTWNLYPNEQLLLENGIPLTAIRQYKSYVSAYQVITPISTQKYEHVPTDKVLKLIDAASSAKAVQVPLYEFIALSTIQSKTSSPGAKKCK